MKSKLGDLLCEISGDINKLFTAKNFMTEKTEIRIFDEKEHIDNLKNYSKQKNYDILLVKRKNNELSYIESKDMENCKNISEIINIISKEEKISIDAQVPEIIDKFKEIRYVFVYDNKDSFEGLITYADLNNSSLYSYLFIFLSDFERLLRKLIKLRFKEDEWLKKLSDDVMEEIGGIFIRCKFRGIETSLLGCATLPQLKEVLFKVKLYNKIKCYNNKKDTYNSMLMKIIECRNAIMHNRNLIKSKEDYDNFYKFIYDFCIQRKEIYNYYTKLKEESNKISVPEI